MSAESNILEDDQDVIELDEAVEESAVLEDDAAVDDAPESVTDEPLADIEDLIADSDESDDVEIAAEPVVPGKRLSLKEKLAARRQAEQGQEVSELEGKWYVLHTYSGYENKVKKTIETRVDSLDIGDRVYEIVVPTQEEIEIKNGQRQTVLKKVFPGYVLVRMELDDETWYALRNTPGVTGFVNVDNKPVQLEENRVQSIMKGMVAEAPKVKVTFALGDTVRINDGPFADFRGEIDEINQEKGKIRVLVSFFGRETPVELDFLQAERET